MIGLIVLELPQELNEQRIDLITIVFRKELDLLKIQAKSIELYIPQHHIGNIYVIVNDGNYVDDLIDRTWWGINSSKVIIINRQTFGVDLTLDGWSSQQLYKLLAAEQAKTSWSMCLDAKTWFVNELKWDLLFDEQKRVKFEWFPVIPVFDSARKTLEGIFNIELVDVIGPGGVPFMFKTSTVKSMINWIQISQKKSFFDFFTSEVKWPKQITEFMLYSIYVKKVHNDYSTLYNNNQYYQIYNIAHNEAEIFNDRFNLMRKKSAFTVSIHRDAYQHLTDIQISWWVDFLFRKNLIADPENFKTAINTLRLQANNV